MMNIMATFYLYNFGSFIPIIFLIWLSLMRSRLCHHRQVYLSTYWLDLRHYIISLYKLGVFPDAFVSFGVYLIFGYYGI